MKKETPNDALRLIDDAIKTKTISLNLSGCGLQRLPPELDQLKDQLRLLYLGKESDSSQTANQITDFSMLQGFPKLRYLELSRMRIPSIDRLSFLTQLEDLHLSFTDISSTKTIEQMVNLRQLWLPGTKVVTIGDKGIMPNLELLNLAYTGTFDASDLSAARFPRLKSLSLSSNPSVKRSLDPLAGFTLMQTLDLSSTGLEDLSFLSALTRLNSLHISHNKFKDISGIASLKELTSLYMWGSQIRDITPLSQLLKLTSLYLNNNQIVDLGPLQQLTSLKYLLLSANSIEDIGPLKNLRSLTNLDLAANKIEDITPLSELPQIQVLDLTSNKIADILPLRKWLETQGPRILFTDNINKSRANYRLGLKGNPISSPPAQYLQAGREAVLNYWQQLDKLAAQKQRLRVVNETRLIIIGNSNVGKSTLSYLLQKGEFPPADLSSTHGLEFSVWRPGWKINDAELTVNIIDFGGQEYYHDTHHLFFTDKAAFLLLWDPNSNKNAKIQTRVGDRDRTEMIQHFGVEYWLNAIEIYGSTSYDTTIYQAVSKEYHEQLLSGEPMREEQEKIPIEEDPRFEAMDARIFSHAPVLLVQTFMDKYGKTFLNMKDLQARYPRLEDAVSVSMDRTRGAARGIDLLRGKIRDLYENMQEITSQTYDVAWLTIRSYIEKEEKDSYHIMTIAAFRDYFLEHADHGMEYTEADTRTLCITLNHWGVVLYRYEMEELRDIVIINPQYFTTQINRLLTEKLRERNGAISRHEVPEILNMDAARANTFIRVLKSFKILFELPRAKEEDEPHYISPMYLQEKPAYVDLFLSQFVAYYKIRYDGYFHKGILLDCFRELGQELLHEKGVYFYWQWGLVLRREGRIICIEFDDTRLDQVVIKMIRHNKESLGKEEFLRDVFIAFEKINRKYKVDIELSCNGSDFVSQQLLLDKMNTGLNKFDLDGKRWDTRDFYFLLHPDEIASPYKRIFISYSRADRRSVDRLTAHLKLYENAGICTYWFDGLLAERHEWDEQIKTEMEKANILIMLLSPDYFGANYIVKEEMPFAISQCNAPEGTRQVFWVLLRPCNYEAFVNVAAHTVYPLKETDSQSEKASQRAISEYEDQDRQWERLLKMILEEM